MEVEFPPLALGRWWTSWGSYVWYATANARDPYLSDAKDGEVRRALVNDDLELLRWCSNGDVANISHLQGPGTEVRADLTAWPPLIPTVLPPSGYPRA